MICYGQHSLAQSKKGALETVPSRGRERSGASSGVLAFRRTTQRIGICLPWLRLLRGSSQTLDATEKREDGIACSCWIRKIAMYRQTTNRARDSQLLKKKLTSFSSCEIIHTSPEKLHPPKEKSFRGPQKSLAKITANVLPYVNLVHKDWER